jgi:hypothetical protein
MNYSQAQKGGDMHRDNFINALSNYSHCMTPYLRNVQERYVGAFYMPENQPVDLAAYCSKEKSLAQSAMDTFSASHQ